MNGVFFVITYNCPDYKEIEFAVRTEEEAREIVARKSSYGDGITHYYDYELVEIMSA